MNSLIFAAGLGTRLKPLTDTMPKAMVPVNGKPLVQILIEKLKTIGVDHIVINVHHFAQQIIDFIRANDSFGVDIQFSDETDMLLETGGGLKKAASLFPDDELILVHNVDILSNADLYSLYDDAMYLNDFISQSDAQDSVMGAMMLVSERVTQRYLIFNNCNNLVGWVNLATGQVKSPHADILAHDGDAEYFRHDPDYHLYAFSGIQFFNPKIVSLMDSWDGKFSIIDFYLSICDKVPIKCCLVENLQLMDVGKLDSLAEAEHFLMHNS